MNKIFRDGTYYAVSTTINLVVSLGSAILIARLLGPEGKGIVTLVVQIASFGSSIVSLGLSQAYQYFLGKKIVTLEEVTGHILIQTLIIVVLMFLVFTSDGGNLLRFITHSSLSDRLLLMAIVLLILNTIASYLNGSLMALKDGVILSSLFSILSTILYGSGIIVFTWFMGWGVMGILIANIFGVCIKIILSCQKIFVSGVNTITFNWFKLSKSLFTYGLSVMVGLFMLSGVLRLDTFIINAYLGTGSLGVYSIAYTIAELLLLIPRSFGVALFPQMNSAVKTDQIIMMAMTARVNLILGIFGALLFVAGGFPAIWLLFGAKFAPAYAALLWILPGVIAMSLTYSYHYFFSSTGRPYILAVIYGLGVFLNIGSNIILIPLMGINGASLSSSITYILITLAFILLISLQEDIPISKIIVPKRADFQALFAVLMRFWMRLRELVVLK